MPAPRLRRDRRQAEGELAPALPVDPHGVLELAAGSAGEKEVPLAVARPVADAFTVADDGIDEGARAVAMHPERQLDGHAGQRGVDGDVEGGLLLLAPREGERPLAAVRLSGTR